MLADTIFVCLIQHDLTYLELYTQKKQETRKRTESETRMQRTELVLLRSFPNDHKDRDKHREVDENIDRTEPTVKDNITAKRWKLHYVLAIQQQFTLL